jgi:hypothetical protein
MFQHFLILHRHPQSFRQIKRDILAHLLVERNNILATSTLDFSLQSPRRLRQIYTISPIPSLWEILDSRK